MKSLSASLRKELFEQWRTYRFLVIASILVIFGILSPVLAKVMPEFISLFPGGEQIALVIPPPTVVDAVTQYIKNISQFGVLLALFISMGAVAQEKDKGTAALILVKPVSRRAFLLAKFIAISLNFLLSIFLAAIAAYFYILILFEPVSFLAWMALNALLWLSMVVIIALTLLFSTLMRSQAAAAGASIGIILFVTILSAIPGLGKYFPTELTNWGTSLLVGTPAPAWIALGISLVCILLCLVIAWAVFEKQEL
jgi:ABC-2 type transport system permease protein